VSEKPFSRADGVDKDTGLGPHTADLVMPGMLHAPFLYPADPRARIVGIDVSRARGLPGV
jgi:aerobic carbon-monoxide dehydrogenase large subunit